MKLLPNWRAVLARSWSVRLTAAAGALQTLAYCWPTGVAFLPDWFGLVPLALIMASFAARLIGQRGLSLPDDGDAA